MVLCAITAVLWNGAGVTINSFGARPAVHQRSESALIRETPSCKRTLAAVTEKTERQEVRHEIHPDPSRRCAEPGSFAGDRFGPGAREQGRRRAALHLQLRRGTRRRYFALVTGGE